MIDQRARLAAERMYRPDMEPDACGTVLITATGDGLRNRTLRGGLDRAKVSA